ncbi:MAG: hypothetical protein V4520_01300 [Bacteroidota bacterium]
MSRFDKIRKLPVFIKADEILELADVLVEALKDDEKTAHFARDILSNAMLIGAKIAGAEGGRLYSLKMQNAVIIKLAVQDMLNAVICTEMFEIGEEDYVELMREKVEEFRLVFVEWIRGFDKAHDIPDNWAIRYDTSTPEQEVLEDLMFDEDKFFNDEGDNDDEDANDDRNK